MRVEAGGAQRAVAQAYAAAAAAERGQTQQQWWPRLQQVVGGALPALDKELDAKQHGETTRKMAGTVQLLQEVVGTELRVWQGVAGPGLEMVRERREARGWLHTVLGAWREEARIATAPTPAARGQADQRRAQQDKCGARLRAVERAAREESEKAEAAAQAARTGRNRRRRRPTEGTSGTPVGLACKRARTCTKRAALVSTLVGRLTALVAHVRLVQRPRKRAVRRWQQALAQVQRERAQRMEEARAVVTSRRAELERERRGERPCASTRNCGAGKHARAQQQRRARLHAERRARKGQTHVRAQVSRILYLRMEKLGDCDFAN